ncbi:hypothetical protein BB559_003936 [Furculomyces boomerangus]|uniref:Uncharacterized protein n=1 Tax=Furculomyces boomerangus TaxID=61424 RepID=A0A2T9YHW0_9FUNG|nr:hypothetical protein BB559_003936 [Furculomyces boomerangus]
MVFDNVSSTIKEFHKDISELSEKMNNLFNLYESVFSWKKPHLVEKQLKNAIDSRNSIIQTKKKEYFDLKSKYDSEYEKARLEYLNRHRENALHAFSNNLKSFQKAKESDFWSFGKNKGVLQTPHNQKVRSVMKSLSPTASANPYHYDKNKETLKSQVSNKKTSAAEKTNELKSQIPLLNSEILVSEDSDNFYSDSDSESGYSNNQSVLNQKSKYISLNKNEIGDNKGASSEGSLDKNHRNHNGEDVVILENEDYY